MVRHQLRSVKRWLKNRLRRTAYRVTETRVVDTVGALVRDRTDCLFLHSSLSACGHVVGGAPTVLRAIGRYAKTLCVPTHTYCYPASRDTAPPVFAIQNTKSLVGRVTNHFLSLPGVFRSVHPTHSVAAFGPAAAKLCEGHELCDTPCGKGTPYEKLIEWDAGVLMFGVSMSVYTLFHTTEDAAGCNYLYEPEPYDLRAVDSDGTLHHIRMWRQDRRVRRRFAQMDTVLQQEGLLRRTRLGAAEVLYIPSARETHEFVLRQLDRDRYYLLQEDFACQLKTGQQCASR